MIGSSSARVRGGQSEGDLPLQGMHQLPDCLPERLGSWKFPLRSEICHCCCHEARNSAISDRELFT